MIEQTINIERMEDVVDVFGSFDENIKLVEHELNVTVVSRDNQLKVSGEAENVMHAVKAIEGLLGLAGRKETITEQNVRYIINLVKAGNESHINDIARDVLCVTAKGKPIKAKTLGQKRYVDAIKKNTITLGIGPAGTGKTYLAVAAAVAAFRDKQVNRIILTRPAVEAGERLGFLPGDLQSKVDPYLRPLYDALFEMLGPETYQKYLERGNIEVAPLAYMRGRTLDDSFIILDEAQIFIHIFFQLTKPDFAIRFAHLQLQIIVLAMIMIIDQVADRLAIDRKQLVARREADLFRYAARDDLADQTAHSFLRLPARAG